MIRGGMHLPWSDFESEGTQAPKKFYNKMIKNPSFKKKLARIGLRERMHRCAAQPAYFAIRAFKTRSQLVQLLADLIVSKNDISCFTGEEFPREQLLGEARDEIEGKGFPGASVARTWIENSFRHVRNLMKGIVIDQFAGALAGLARATRPSGSCLSKMQDDMMKDITGHAAKFLQVLSRRLTTRYKKVFLPGKKPGGTFAAGSLDEQVNSILESRLATGCRGDDLQAWKKARKAWRDETLAGLSRALDWQDAREVVDEAVKRARDSLEPGHILNCMFKGVRTRYYRARDASVASFKEHLVAMLVPGIKEALIERMLGSVESMLERGLEILSGNPSTFLTVPRFTRCTIPLGPDDGQVYALHETDDGVDVAVSFFTKKQWKGITGDTVREPATDKGSASRAGTNVMGFALGTIERFKEMTGAGYAPKRGVLSKKRGGGLVVHVSFERKVDKGTRQDLEPGRVFRVASGDIGLKDLMTISIDDLECTGHGTWKVPGDPATWFHRLHHPGDSARYFLDQAQLAGPRDEWFLGAPDPVHSIPNFKRKLVSLQKEGHRQKSKLDRYRNKHPKAFKRHRKHFKLRREWKRTWMKINNIHEELAKQVATRFVSVCEHEQVDVIRMEDLSWSKCSSRKNVGLFLATWQVHWFYSQVQAHVATMARRKGMFVELVNPRNTSKKCSRCGNHGERKGKTFRCTNPACGLVLDSDLNAARNIHVAPLSAVATRSRGGVPLHPIPLTATA
jgi:IS605 OrfB family transposase